MNDHDYRELIRTYDLETLRASRARLDAAEFPDRLDWLDAEIDRRRRGEPALPPPVPASLDFSRDEIFGGFFWRLGALIIDLAIVFIPVDYLLVWLLESGRLWPIVLLPFVFPFYNVAFIAGCGQTPGKWAMGLVVTAADGSPVKGVQAIKRHFPDLAFGTTMALSLAIALVSGMSLSPAIESPLRMFERELTLWHTLDNLWTLWICSELVFLALDSRRRSLHEFISDTLVLHRARKGELNLHRHFDPSWYDWLEVRLGLKASG
ncbi:MAG: RDD family protein [Pseudomonadales bacterium]|nr:RDD family protein [Pseudomonadales bacterium]